MYNRLLAIQNQEYTPQNLRVRLTQSSINNIKREYYVLLIDARTAELRIEEYIQFTLERWASNTTSGFTVDDINNFKAQLNTTL
jgi:hypothetical protein